MRFLITAAVLLLTAAANADDSPADRIAPYLTDTALVVARVDLEKLDIDAAFEELRPFLDMIPDESVPLFDRVKALKESGFREMFFVFDPAELGRENYYVVLPLREVAVLPNFVGTPQYMKSDDVHISGSTEIIEHFKNEPEASERPGLSAAFKAYEGAPIQFVIAPTADQSRVLREMLPDLSGEYGNATGAELSGGLQWASLGIGGPSKAFLTIQSENEAAATILKQAMITGLKDAAENEKVRKLLPMAPQLVAALTPVQDGSRLRIGLDEKTDLTLQALARLVSAAQEDANREATKNRLKQFGLAMHNFHDKYKSLPSSASYSKDGKPLLSWRVFVLPYIEEQELYREFHLDEPWDSEHNKQLIEKIPDVFRSPLTPTEPGTTVFQVPVGNGLMFDGKTGTSIRDITDGTSNTIMIVETTAEQAVPWTKPDDLEVTLDNPLAGLAENRDGFWTAFADGSARFIAGEIEPKTMKKILTRAGGEVFESDEIP